MFETPSMHNSSGLSMFLFSAGHSMCDLRWPSRPSSHTQQVLQAQGRCGIPTTVGGVKSSQKAGASPVSRTSCANSTISGSAIITHPRLHDGPSKNAYCASSTPDSESRLKCSYPTSQNLPPLAWPGLSSLHLTVLKIRACVLESFTFTFPRTLEST